jgi:hypothetical protein
MPTLVDRLRESPRPIVSSYPDHWELVVPFGTIPPKGSVWSTDPIYIGANADSDLTISATVFAENLPDPQPVELRASIRAMTRPMTKEDLGDSRA